MQKVQTDNKPVYNVLSHTANITRVWRTHFWQQIVLLNIAMFSVTLWPRTRCLFPKNLSPPSAYGLEFTPRQVANYAADPIRFH